MGKINHKNHVPITTPIHNTSSNSVSNIKEGFTMGIGAGIGAGIGSSIGRNMTESFFNLFSRETKIDKIDNPVDKLENKMEISPEYKSKNDCIKEENELIRCLRTNVWHEKCYDQQIELRNCFFKNS